MVAKDGSCTKLPPTADGNRDLRIEGRGLLANLRDKDNLSTVDKTPAPDVSVIWRFHCSIVMTSVAASGMN